MMNAQSYGAASRRLQDEEDRSIGTAMRATFWFVAILLLLLWAGVADAAPVVAASAPVVAHAG